MCQTAFRWKLESQNVEDNVLKIIMYICQTMDSYTHTVSSLPTIIPSLGKLFMHKKEIIFSAKWAKSPDAHIFKEFKIERLVYMCKTGQNATAFQFHVNLCGSWSEQGKNTISLPSEHTTDYYREVKPEVHI